MTAAGFSGGTMKGRMVYLTRQSNVLSVKSSADEVRGFVLAGPRGLNGWHAEPFATLIDALRGVVVRRARNLVFERHLVY